eukprot:1027829-Prymnesium_polylepis.1
MLLLTTALVAVRRDDCGCESGSGSGGERSRLSPLMGDAAGERATVQPVPQRGQRGADGRLGVAAACP